MNRILKVLTGVNAFFFLLGFSVSAQATTLLKNGFYRYQKQKVVWVYSDLLPGSHGKVFGNFATDAQSILFTSSATANGQINFEDAKGTSVRLSDFEYLGLTQVDAAHALGMLPNFSPTVYLAHRGTAQIPVLGSKSVFPGNTVAAMSLALENGYRGFEFDVQLTKDKKFLVSHDEDLGVSTSCSGNVSDYNLSDLSPCRVLYTGLIPEEKILHSPAEVSQPLPSLQLVLQTFLPDARVVHLTVDTKPGEIDAQVAAFQLLLSTIPEVQQAKLIFLIRDLQIETRLRALGFNSPIYALEGDKGWEPLQSTGPNPNAHAISLSLGIGLGLAGDGDQSIVSVLLSLPEFFKQGNANDWKGGSVDISCIQWLPVTLKKFIVLENDLEAKKVPVIGWTVNAGDKVSWLRKNTPHLPAVISDLPFSEISKLEVAELQPPIAELP